MKQARWYVDYPFGSRYEIGLRTETVFRTEPPTSYDECIAADCDLWDFATVDSWARLTRGDDGEIVHIYVYGHGEHGELIDTVMGWIGTKEHPAVLVNVPGVYTLGK